MSRGTPPGGEAPTYRTQLAAAIVERVLAWHPGEAGPGVDGASAHIAALYPSEEAQRVLRRSIDSELSSLFPGLKADIGVSSETTIADLKSQVAVRIDDWLGE